MKTQLAIILAGAALLEQFDPPYQNLLAAVFVLGVVLYLVFAVEAKRAPR